MTESAGSKIKLFNPLTSVFVSSVILYTIFCIYWDTIVTRNIEFYDYLSMLFYPVSYPYDQVSLYYERLKDPYTGHPWGWEFFACLFLAISLLIALFMSIYKNVNSYGYFIDIGVDSWSIFVVCRKCNGLIIC